MVPEITTTYNGKPRVILEGESGNRYPLIDEQSLENPHFIIPDSEVVQFSRDTHEKKFFLTYPSDIWYLCAELLSYSLTEDQNGEPVLLSQTKCQVGDESDLAELEEENGLFKSLEPTRGQLVIKGLDGEGLNILVSIGYAPDKKRKTEKFVWTV